MTLKDILLQIEIGGYPLCVTKKNLLVYTGQKNSCGNAIWFRGQKELKLFIMHYIMSLSNGLAGL